MLTEIKMTIETPYAEIKEWYQANMDQLPDSLDGETKYYPDVKFSAEIFISQIDAVIAKGKAKGNNTAEAAKSNLRTLYRDLQDPTAWNLGLCKTWDEKEERLKARRKFHQR